MAVAAVNAQAAHVVFMAERDWLLWRNVLVRDVGRTLKFQQSCSNRGEKKNYAKYAGPRQCVRTTMKDL